MHDRAIPLLEKSVTGVRLLPKISHLRLESPAGQPGEAGALEGVVALGGEFGRLLPAGLIHRLVERLGDVEAVVDDVGVGCSSPTIWSGHLCWKPQGSTMCHPSAYPSKAPRACCGISRRSSVRRPRAQRSVMKISCSPSPPFRFRTSRPQRISRRQAAPQIRSSAHPTPPRNVGIQIPTTYIADQPLNQAPFGSDSIFRSPGKRLYRAVIVGIRGWE